MMRLATCMMLAVTCWAQAEPDTTDVFYRLDGDRLVTLERQTAVIKGKTSGFTVVGMKTLSEFPGAKSSVRFPAATDLEFVVRTPLARAGTVDPNTLFCLRKLEPKKNSRQLTIMSGRASPVGASTSTNMAQGVLPVTFSKHGAGSLKLAAGALPPGEYAVSKVYGQVVFCFGVDK